MKTHLLIAGLMVITFLSSIYSQPVLYAEHGVFNPGDTLSFKFADGPGNPSDWIGIFKLGNTPSQGTLIEYLYVNSTHTPGIGFTEGRVAFTSKLPQEGDYWAGFFENDKYTLLAADTFKITAGQPFITLNKYEYIPGEAFSVNFKNGPGNSTDWIGIYKTGDTAGSKPLTLWKYVNGTQQATSGLPQGTVFFDSGYINNGMWWAGLFENDGYTLLDSVGFIVRSLTAVEEQPVIADSWQLNQNYPNPFNPATKIKYNVAEPALVSVIIYDALGRQITELVNEYKSKGIYETEFNADTFKLGSGIYFYTFKAGNFITTMKMILLK